MFKNIVFRNREFRLLWLAQLVAFIGEGVFQAAMIWWVVKITGSGTTVGKIVSMSFLPAVLIGPFAGTLADRLRPRLLLVGADLFRAALIAVFSYMAFTEHLVVNQLYWLCGLLSAAGVFHSPTTLTVIPQVVKETEIDEAMALHTIVRDISKLAGPALGGMIIARWSVGHAFAVHSACLVFSALMVMLMNIGHIKPEPTEESVISQLKGGFSYAWSQKTLFTLLISFGVLNLFVVPIIVLIPLSIQKIFLAGNSAGADGLISLGIFSIKGSLAFGISEGVLAFGSVITGLFFVKLFSKVRNSRILIGALVANAALFFVFSVNTQFAIFLIGLFLLGSCFTSVNVAVLSLFQGTVAQEMKGRFFALVEVLSFALFPISLAAAGTLADKLGVEKCFSICGVGIAAIVLILILKKDLREIDK